MSSTLTSPGYVPNGNGRTPMTPYQPPLPPLPIQGTTTPIHLPSPATPPDSSSDNFSSDDQVSRLSESFKQQSKTIGLFYCGNRDLAFDIARNLNGFLSGGNIRTAEIEMKKDGQHWSAVASTEGVKYYAFVGYPPARTKPLFTRQHSSSEKEDDFFKPMNDSGRRVASVVFIDLKVATPSSQKSYIPKQQKSFLHLDGSMGASELAKKLLGHFAASQPVPFEIDRAYWSKVPKLISVTKDKPTLGITLVTREMSPSSAFPRIALIKALNGDCVTDLHNRVGRYTHIQSINGCFLDGFSIKNISAIFQAETKKDSVQLMVRYIHSQERNTSDGGSTPQLPIAAPLDPTREDLPVPLFILSNSHEAATKLYNWLTTDVGPRRSSLLPPSSTTTTTVVSADSYASDPKFQVGGNGSNVSAPDENGDGIGPLESSIKKQANKIWFDPVYEDEVLRRASISSNLASAEYSPTTPGPSKPDFKRMLSVNKNIASRRYIPQIFNNGFERRFAHVFLRTAGVYLITAWFTDLAYDPLIQFENLSHWLRLIQQRTDCAEEKRVIIVGLYNGADREEVDRIKRYAGTLNEALQESELHKQLFDQNRWLHGPNSRFVFMFDVSQYADSCHDLYARIEQCMDLFAEKAYRFYPERFERVFKAFDGLNVALRELSALKKVVASSEDLRTICKQKPDYALGTMQAYSPALIDSSVSEAALLKPQFLIELMTKLGTKLTQEDSVYAVFQISDPLLKPLPVVTEPWPDCVMDAMQHTSMGPPLTKQEKKAVTQWAELLGLMFRIETDGPQKHTYFFVPSLAAEMMEKSHWSVEKEQHFRASEATVLYAYLHFPGNHQFFNRLLAVLIKEGLGLKRREHMYINCGCMEAIMPLCLKDNFGNFDVDVMTVYHPLQNVIEFRTRISTAEKAKFKEAVQDKLDIAFSSSIYRKVCNFGHAVTFHVPSKKYDEKLTQSALWKLKELEVEQAEDETEQEEAEEKLLRTRELDMAKWTTIRSHRLEIPSDLFIKWARTLGSSDDYWTQVGAKLKLLTTVDINHLRTQPNHLGNGHEVLTRWQNSDLRVEDLVRALREVGLKVIAQEIESFYAQPTTDV